MAEGTVEKKLLYLILCSLMLHGALFAILQYLPAGGKLPPAEPLMVDLQDLTELRPPPMESLPRVSRDTRVGRRLPAEDVQRELPPEPREPASSFLPATPRSSQPGWPVPKELQQDGPSRDELFRGREKGRPADQVNLFPSAARMAAIEERYRKKYGEEVAQGGASFLNTDDILFGSFLRRFENAVYGVWRYPPDAAKMGIEGVTPVRITFNRRGEIVARELLQSSGSRILDDEVMRTLSKVGAVGSFPRGYDKETFDLIAFFHYGITGGAQRSLR